MAERRRTGTEHANATGRYVIWAGSAVMLVAASVGIVDEQRPWLPWFGIGLAIWFAGLLAHRRQR